MDKIHDKASNFFNDFNKTKLTLGKNSHKEQGNKASSHATCISHCCCVYCPKGFINSRYLIKHIMRRHSDELVSLHKNYIKHESKNSGDLQYFISLIQAEFSSLKEELLSGNVTVTDELNKKTAVKENSELQENATEVPVESGTSGYNADSKEVRVMKKKLDEMEKNNQNLYFKVAELNNMLKNEVLLKQDVTNHLSLNEENILRAQESQFIQLREVLLSELKILYNQLQESKNEWNSQFLDQKNEIKRLDWAVSTVKKQVEYPDKIKEIEKRLEHHIIQFLSTSKCKNTKANSLRGKTESRGYKSHHQPLQKKKLHSKNPENKAPKLSKQKEHSGISLTQLSLLVSKKMSQFSIASDAAKLSNAEFEEKLQLINAEKEYLAKKYHKFSEFHNTLNMCANQKAENRLKDKKYRKIRFSDPLTSNDIIASSSKMCDNSNTCESSSFLLNENKQLSDLKNQELSDTECEELVVSKKKIHSVHKSKGFMLPDYGEGDEGCQAAHEHEKLFVSQKKLSPVHESNRCMFPDYGGGGEGCQTAHKHENLFVSQKKLSPVHESNRCMYTDYDERSECSQAPHKYEELLVSSSVHESEGFMPIDYGEGSDCFQQFSSKECSPIEQIVSVSKQFKTSSPVRDFHESKELNCAFAKDCSSIISLSNDKIPRCAFELKKNFDYALNVQSMKNEELKVVKHFPELCEAKNSSTKLEDDFDDISLESLSSWDEEEDNPLEGCIKKDTGKI